MNFDGTVTRTGSQSFQALLGTFQADHLPTYLNNEPTRDISMQNRGYFVSELPAPFEGIAPTISRNDVATVSNDVSMSVSRTALSITQPFLPPKVSASDMGDRGTQIGGEISNGDPTSQSPRACASFDGSLLDHDRLNQELDEGFKLLEDHEQERDRLVSKLKQSVADMQARFIAMKYENSLLPSKLAAQHATAYLSELEKKLTKSENERNTAEEANLLLRAELELVYSKNLQLETTMKGNDATAQANLLEIEKKLTHSERKRKNLEESDQSLRAELELANNKKQQLELTLQDNVTSSKASVLELQDKLARSENERMILGEANKSLQTELDTLDSKKRQLEFTLDNTEELKHMLMNDLESATSDLEASHNELMAAKVECEALSSSKSTYSVLCKHLTQALNTKKNEESEHKEEITRLKNEISMLTERLKSKDNVCVIG